MNPQAANWVSIAQLMMPLAAAFIAAMLAIPAYLVNARINRNEVLLAKRREVFAAYIKAIQLNIVAKKDQAEYHEAYASIFIYGTDEVIRTVRAFHDEMADKAGRIDGPRAAEAYARMVSAMRSDCFSSSKLGVDELKRLAPFEYK